jgi:hypothetical protein
MKSHIGGFLPEKVSDTINKALIATGRNITTAMQTTGNFLVGQDAGLMINYGIRGGANLSIPSSLLTLGFSIPFVQDSDNLLDPVKNAACAALSGFFLGFAYGAGGTAFTIYGKPEPPKGAVSKEIVPIEKLAFTDGETKLVDDTVVFWRDANGKTIAVDMKNMKPIWDEENRVFRYITEPMPKNVTTRFTQTGKYALSGEPVEAIIQKRLFYGSSEIQKENFFTFYSFAEKYKIKPLMLEPHSPKPCEVYKVYDGYSAPTIPDYNISPEFKFEN